VSAVRCTVCGAATAARSDAVKHTCEFCGATFLLQATHAAAGAAEQRLRARIDAIQPELDQLDAEAIRLAGAGDLAGAHRHAYESVRRVAVLYEETGYNRLLGCDTPETVDRNVGQLFAMHLQRLGIPDIGPSPATKPAVTPGYDQMVAALQAQDFDAAMAGYTTMCRAQIDADPRWADRDRHERDQVVSSSIHAFAFGLPWATPDDYARHGIELPCLTRRADGTTAVTCTRCGVEVVLAQLAESVQCTHCAATFRIRLTGIDVYHARGHTDVTPEQVEDQRIAEAMARGDLGARMTYARKLIAGQAPPDSDRDRELGFVYTLQVGAPLSEEQQVTIAGQLGLGPPRTCRQCSAAIALAPSSSKCPMCSGNP